MGTKDVKAIKGIKSEQKRKALVQSSGGIKAACDYSLATRKYGVDKEPQIGGWTSEGSKKSNVKAARPGGGHGGGGTSGAPIE